MPVHAHTRAFGRVRNTRKDNCISHARCNAPLPSCEENHSCLLHIFVYLPPFSLTSTHALLSLHLCRASAHSYTQLWIYSFMHTARSIDTHTQITHTERFRSSRSLSLFLHCTRKQIIYNLTTRHVIHTRVEFSVRSRACIRFPTVHNTYIYVHINSRFC